MQIILDTQFKHLEHFLEEVRHFDLDFRLLGAGGFKCSLKQLVSQKVLLGYGRFHRSLDQVGATPLGYRTFVILGPRCHGFRWRGHQITQNDLLIFPSSNELHSASHDDFEIFTISIHLDYIEQLMDAFGLNEIPDKQEVVRMDEPIAYKLRSLAASIIQFSASEVDVAQALAHNLAEKLLITAAKPYSTKITNLRKRDIALNRIVEFVRNTKNPTSNLEQLCRIANVSERTLQYAFKDQYGITPTTFVKRWNLNTIRRQLLLAHPDETKVNNICMEFNISHQSQFATDYKKIFAELPSDTLNSKLYRK